MKKFFDLRSLSLTSSLLGILLVLIDSLGHYEGLPENLLVVGQIVTFILTFFGLFNAAKASEEDLIEKFKQFANSKFGGFVLVSVLTYLANLIPDSPDAPAGYIVIAKVIGAILTVLLGTAGSRELFVKARLNNTPVAKKYEVYLR